MKIKNKFKLFFVLLIVCAFFVLNCSTISAANQELTTGTYTSNDEHTITINEDGTILYDGTYSLTITANDRGDKLTGKLGTNKKSATFYQLNSSKLISGAVMNYKHDGATVYLYDYTIFSLDCEPVVDNDGGIEVWSNGNKLNTYGDLQSAVDASQSGDTIKITKDLDVVGGAYIKGKTLTIEGENHTLNSATWANSVFIVEEDATLNINNLTIDGKATGFEVDYDAVDILTNKSYKIPLKTDSDINDPTRNLAVIISKGDLNIDKSNINNNYTTGNGTVNIVSGNVKLTNSKFDHNRASKGGALYIGSNFKINQTTYPVENVVIDTSDFTSNYSTGNGGAIFILNTEKIEINNSNLIKSTGNNASGGAIVVEKQSATGYHSMAQKLGLDYYQLKIDNCIFDGNWVGNDGAAIENKDAELTITNTTFKNNVGVHCSSSVGTVSVVIGRGTENKHIFKNCIFESNVGAGSVFGDHSSAGAIVEFTDTKFMRNESGYNSILLYEANATFTNCEFIEECAAITVVEIRSRNSDAEEAKVVFNNVTFKDTEKDSMDIYLRKSNTDEHLYTVVIEGNTTANINVHNQNQLIINGNYTGTIKTDGQTGTENIIINQEATMNGEIIYNTDKYAVALLYPHLEKGYLFTRLIYTEPRTFTNQEFYMEHFVTEDGYELRYYTDAEYTTEWDYTVSSSMTVYGKWVEHEHTYDESVTLYENAIYEQCTCGYLGKSLTLEVPSDLVENGKEIGIVVNNELGIASSEYSIVYQVKKEDRTWKEMTGVPVNKGTYKAILTYKNMSIEQEYSIAEKIEIPDSSDNTNDKTENSGEASNKSEDVSNVTDKTETANTVIDKTDNPDTSDNIFISILTVIISLVAIVLISIQYRKEIKK